MTLAAGSRPPLAKMPPHNFGKYEFGSGPPVRGTDVSKDRSLQTTIQVGRWLWH